MHLPEDPEELREALKVLGQSLENQGTIEHLADNVIRTALEHGYNIRSKKWLDMVYKIFNKPFSKEALLRAGQISNQKKIPMDDVLHCQREVLLRTREAVLRKCRCR